MIYFTFGEGYSGVYKGQVIDVCKYLSQLTNEKVRIISFISVRNYFQTRKKIKHNYRNSIVVPMLPKASTWQLNLPVLYLISLFLNERKFICRNVKAANLALNLKKIGWVKKVVLDGRGAFAAEYKEYLNNGSSKSDKIFLLERKAVLNSDFRIAVSEKLIQYWREEYDYKSEDHVVIPCTVDLNMKINELSKEKSTFLKKELGFTADNVLMVYSGSLAGWQSFDLIERFVEKILFENKKAGILFLSKLNGKIENLIKKFPERVACRWVNPNDVVIYLSICDYGLLIREDSITNRVAAPTKFAEYLLAGLSVIISENVGDYSDFVEENNSGYVIDDSENFQLDLVKISNSKRLMNVNLAKEYFTKQSDINTRKFQYLLNQLT